MGHPRRWLIPAHRVPAPPRAAGAGAAVRRSSMRISVTAAEQHSNYYVCDCGNRCEPEYDITTGGRRWGGSHSGSIVTKNIVYSSYFKAGVLRASVSLRRRCASCAESKMWKLEIGEGGAVHIWDRCPCGASAVRRVDARHYRPLARNAIPGASTAAERRRLAAAAAALARRGERAGAYLLASAPASPGLQLEPRGF